MPSNMKTTILFLSLFIVLASCSPKNISTRYYVENEKVLDKIQSTYEKINSKTPFQLGFTSHDFNTLSLGIKTDSLHYIYEFQATEARLGDTLSKFGFPPDQVNSLVTMMQSIRCIWINNYDFYVDEKKQSLTFISIKPVALKALFSNQKYYIISYFKKRQYFDENGQLLDKRSERRLRKLNGDTFYRINDRVCYTISEKFR